MHQKFSEFQTKEGNFIFDNNIRDKDISVFAKKNYLILLENNNNYDKNLHKVTRNN